MNLTSEQVNALQIGISSINDRIHRLSLEVERLGNAIESPRAKVVENGLFYKRHMDAIEENMAVIKALRQAHRELIQMKNEKL